MMAAARADNGVDVQDLATALVGVLPDPRKYIQLAETKPGGEVAGPCPRCGGTDRFFIRPDGSFMCRQCGVKGGDSIDFFAMYHQTDFNGLVQQYLGNGGQTPKREPARSIPENLVTTYSYVDESGVELFQVRRYEEKGRSKTFRQGIGTPWGDFKPGIKGIRRVVYRLPEVGKASTVFLLEGEKDVDRLAEIGLTSTTSPMGASNWRAEYSQFLKGKDIIILPDNDQPGRQYASRAAADLDGVAKSVRIVHLPGLPPKGDVSDWLDAGGSKDALHALVNDAPIYQKPAQLVEKKSRTSSTADYVAPPIDIFGDVSLSGEPEWPANACPSVIDLFSQDCADRLGVTVQMIAVPAIVTAAASIADAFKLQPKRHDDQWSESCRLWAAIVADPGEKKSPAIDMAVRPLKRIECQWFEEDSILMEQYEAALEEYERAKNTTRPVTEKPEKPRQRRKLVGDATVESLADVLKDNPDGVLSYRDELSGWVASFDAYKGKGSSGSDRAAFLEAYNGGSRMIDRVKRGRELIPNWSVSMIGGIQPGPLKRQLGKIADDGLIQRFMVVFGRKTGDGVDRPPDYRALNAYRDLIVNLTRLRPPDAPIRLSDGAQVQRGIVDSVVSSVALLPDTSAAFKAHLSKWGGLFARLALTFHIVEHAACGVIPGNVDGETASQVARLMLDFLLPNAARFYSDILGADDHMIDARWIAGHILATRAEKLTVRDVYRAYRKLRDDPKAINAALQTLSIAGWVSPLNPDAKPYPTKWSVNPTVHESFSNRAQAEARRRDQVKAEISKAVNFLSLVKTEA